jgi:hypothetical protein
MASFQLYFIWCSWLLQIFILKAETWYEEMADEIDTNPTSSRVTSLTCSRLTLTLPLLQVINLATSVSYIMTEMCEVWGWNLNACAV